MRFHLRFTSDARDDLVRLESTQALAKRLKAVRKALGLMETNLRHPGLNTHKYSALTGPDGAEIAEIFESYAENRTPGAYRIFWCCASRKDSITVLSIVPHP